MEEWRRAYQSFYEASLRQNSLQAITSSPVQLVSSCLFLISWLKAVLDVLEVGSGTGNLAETIVNNSFVHAIYFYKDKQGINRSWTTWES